MSNLRDKQSGEVKQNDERNKHTTSLIMAPSFDQADWKIAAVCPRGPSSWEKEEILNYPIN